MWNEISKTSWERSVSPSTAPHTTFPQHITSNLHNFNAFLSPLESPSTPQQRKVEHTISQFHALCMTLSRYTKKGGISLCKFLMPTKEISDREDLFSCRDWVIINISVRECPSTLSACYAPQRHASSTNIFTSTTQEKNKWRRTHKHPDISSLPHQL